MKDCEHYWVYQGRYGKVDQRPLPGTGSLRVEILDIYFCRRCLEQFQRHTGLEGYQTYGAKVWEGEFIT